MTCINTNNDCAIPGENYLVCHWEPVCQPHGNCTSNYEFSLRLYVNGSCENDIYYDGVYKYGSNPIRRDCKLNEYQWKKSLIYFLIGKSVNQ